MNIDQMLGSIKGYFYKQWNVVCLTKQIPIEVPIPSMFFPSSNTIANPDTKLNYENTYSLNVKLFHQSSAEALIQAENIAQSIRKHRESIPLLNPDGTETSNSIIFERIETEIIDTGVAQISLQWNYKFNYI